MAHRVKLIDHTREGTRVTFVFGAKQDLRPLISDFMNGMPVSVSAFIHALQTLKALIHS